MHFKFSIAVDFGFISLQKSNLCVIVLACSDLFTIASQLF